MMRRPKSKWRQCSKGEEEEGVEGEEGLISEILLEIAPPSKGEIPPVSTRVMIRRRGSLGRKTLGWKRERWPR